MIRDLLLLFQVYLILWGFQLLAWPWLFHLNRGLVDRGWSLGRTATGLVVAVIVWSGAHLSLPVNSEFGITAVFGVLFCLTFFFRKKEIGEAFVGLSKMGWVIGTEELLFLVGFIVYALVRGYQPSILGLEKFMDFGFIKSYLSSPTLPAADMWWAGKTINYYSFGHFFASVLIRTWGVGAEIGYNIVLAFILGSSLALSFSIVVNLFGEAVGKWRRIFSGLIGAFLVVLGGNSHAIWSLLSKKTLAGYWYADATRFIENTIHEFPAYSFVVSDLHGHVLDLPVVLAFLLFFVGWTKRSREEKKEKIIDEIILGLMLGIMAMTNTWDSAIYGLLLLIYAGVLLISNRRELPRLIFSGGRVAIAAIVTASFWLIGFKSISDGVAAVTTRSPLWQLLVLWSIQAAVTFWAMSVALKKRGGELLIVALGLTAIALILIPEFIFVRDIYPGHPRANTMFKLTYQAFILMGLLFGWLWGQARGFVGIILAAAFVSLMIFPSLAFPSYFNSFRLYRGLDGFDFLTERYTDDLSVIRFLTKNRNGKNMVEAVGDSYTEMDFVSAFSGTPTVLGWRVHEWLWRGGYEQVGKRDEEVRRFYEEGSISEAREMIEKYDLGWILVGGREREKYKRLNENKINSLGEQIDFGSTSYLVKIR